MQDPNQASQNAPGQDATEAQPASAQHAAELGLAPGMDAAAAAAAADNAPENGIDRMPSLEDALRQAELKAAEHHDAWLRAKAETENMRRRAQEDIAKASKFAAEKFATAMLPVKDSLEAALAVENQTVDKIREGVELTLRQLVSAFEGAKLAEENPLGQKFDPNKHQAISVVEADAEPNTVVTVLQKGYLLNERVIRPAMVMVAKAKG
ncbi:nucleotide exchange factor GrpE [Thauera sp.]|jgi:molecular chaperone GrpE|uniref:nucleotide exchange factor GrpE n=1 Tax=Thauera sp. TaxID=1905334 RepID=UPI002A36441D|nr:nucleotide exchange factor GrpE [Thauera sp.]MDX9884967.1 nucleotide exchange factor GrpE [Thauera sp.]